MVVYMRPAPTATKIIHGRPRTPPDRGLAQALHQIARWGLQQTGDRAERDSIVLATQTLAYRDQPPGVALAFGSSPFQTTCPAFKFEASGARADKGHPIAQ